MKQKFKVWIFHVQIPILQFKTQISSQLPQDLKDLKPGVNINRIDSFTPEMKEIPVEAIISTDIRVIDTFDGMLFEAGAVIETFKKVLSKNFILGTGRNH